MRFFRRVAGLLGFGRDDAHEPKDEDDDNNNNNSDNSDYQARNRAHFQETGLPRRGFSVPVQVPVERPLIGPVLAPCNPGDGGLQGLRWYAKRLRIDEDGDVADEFLDEVLPETSTGTEDCHRPMPRLEVKYSTKPAKVKNQALSLDGKIQHYVEHQGRLQWV